MIIKQLNMKYLCRFRKIEDHTFQRDGKEGGEQLYMVLGWKSGFLNSGQRHQGNIATMLEQVKDLPLRRIPSANGEHFRGLIGYNLNTEYGVHKRWRYG